MAYFVTYPTARREAYSPSPPFPRGYSMATVRVHHRTTTHVGIYRVRQLVVTPGA